MCPLHLHLVDHVPRRERAVRIRATEHASGREQSLPAICVVVHVLVFRGVSARQDDTSELLSLMRCILMGGLFCAVVSGQLRDASLELAG